MPAEVSSSPDHDAEGAQVNCASMDLAIQSSSLSVSLHSRASLNAEAIGLSAQTRLLSEQLADLHIKLDEANYKIGFLEAQLLAQTEKTQELRNCLRETKSARKSFKNWLKTAFAGG